MKGCQLGNFGKRHISEHFTMNGLNVLFSMILTISRKDNANETLQMSIVQIPISTKENHWYSAVKLVDDI